MSEKPIGRIDYLHTDGRVRESVEYTSEYMLKKDIKEELYYGVPLVLVLYRNANGNVMSSDFLSSLDTMPKNIIIADLPQETEKKV